MTPYRHLLCPVDFSDVSRMALEWAVGFSREINARLTVIHVLDTGLEGLGNLVAVPDVVSELRTSAQGKIREWEHEMDLSKVKIDLVEGSPDEAILEVAAKGVDLVVMGTHGLSGFQKLFLGSVTEKVLHGSKTPLLTFSPKTKSSADGKFERPKTILLAVDFGEESQSLVRHGVWLSEHYRATLLAAHFVPVPYVVLNDRTLERLGPAQLKRLEESLTADRRADLEALLPPSSGGMVEIVVRVGSPFDSLRELATERSVDLVVMGAGGHGSSGIGWLGSTVHKMVRSASCPVLVVR